jgi:hypothetical protein
MDAVNLLTLDNVFHVGGEEDVWLTCMACLAGAISPIFAQAEQEAARLGLEGGDRDEMSRLPYEMVKPPHSHQIGGNLSHIDTITARPSYAITKGASVFECLDSRRSSCRTKVLFAQLSVYMYYLYVNVNSKVVGLPQQATSRWSG